MSNLISRQDAIKHIKTYRDEFKEDFGIDSENEDDASHYFGYVAGLNRATRIIEGLPSAESETCEGCKHLGKWEDEITYGYPSPCITCKRIVKTIMKDDLISRKSALKVMDTWDKFGCDPNGKLVRCDDDKHYILYVHYEDMVHAIKNLPSAEPDNDMIHLQKEQAFLQGWEAGRKALRKEMWEIDEVEG